MMAQPRQQGLDHGSSAEEVVPLVVIEVGGDQGRATVVALLHELEEDVGLLGLEIEIPHLVDEKQIEACEAVDEFA